MFDFMNERNKIKSMSEFDDRSVREVALIWWDGLSSNVQRDIEFETYGYGDPCEDNRITDADIEHMYIRIKYDK